MVIPPDAFDRYLKQVDLKHLRHFGLPIVFVVGKPGSSKATLCHRLAQRHDLSYVTIGQVLRDEASTSTARGRTLAQYVYAEPTKTVPKALLMDILKETISRLLYVHRPIVISGFPKNYEQAMELENLGLPIKHLIYLNVSNETAKARIHRKNQYCEISPISQEGIERRLTAFDQHTLPVIQLLDKEKRVWEMDANGDPGTLLKQVNELYATWLQQSKQGAEFIADPSALAGQESLVTTHVPHAFPRAVRPAGHPVSKALHPPIIPPVRQRHYGLSHTKVAFR